MNTAHELDWYEIRVQGHLGDRWAAWFDGMSVERAPHGVTVLRGPVVDQTALHGLFARLRDLGLPLISVISVISTDSSTDPADDAGTDREIRPGPDDGLEPDHGQTDP